jgi:C_GCAxxG_C_C family probable redox protein
MIPESIATASGLTPEQMRMVELAQQGFHCSEVLMFMGLEAQGKENPDLIKAMSALAGGIGFTGETCGALTGGACVLGLHAGRGSATDEENPKLKTMIAELVDWFSAKYGEKYGGVLCRIITEDDPLKAPERCPRIVVSVFYKVKSLLAENGFEWTGQR